MFKYLNPTGKIGNKQNKKEETVSFFKVTKDGKVKIDR